MTGKQLIVARGHPVALRSAGTGITAPPPPRPAAAADPDDVVRSQRSNALVAAVVAGIAFGGVLSWAFIARLDDGALASGSIVAASKYTPISNFEGGTIKELLVREGDTVTAGQVLVRLDPTLAEAQLGQIRNQYWVSLAQQDRLLAEQQDKRSFEFSPELLTNQHEPMVREAMQEQLRQFKARWQSFDAQVDVNRNHIKEVAAELKANQALAETSRERLTYTLEALEKYRKLRDMGYLRLDQLLALQSAVSDLNGRIQQYDQTAEKNREAMQSYELLITQQEKDRKASIAADLQTVRAAIAHLPDQIRATSDIVARKEVRAPTDGRVVNLKFFTVGSVVSPGAPIMEIVPGEDDLVAEVRVSPSDIERMRPGLPAEVRLNAYKSSVVPPIEGAVIVVGADRLSDPITKADYFLARIRLSSAELAKWKNRQGVELYPGLPVEAIVAKGERRAIDYFLEPITDTFWRAFREK